MSPTPKPRPSARGIAAPLVAATLAGVSFASAAVARGEVSPSVAELQQTVIDVVAAAERSVVAVSRLARAPAAMGAGQAALEGFGPNPADPRQFDPFADLRAQGIAPTPAVTGCGVVIGEGLVLTQYLVVEPGDSHFVTDTRGERWPAQIKAADPRSGLAVLELEGRADAELPPAITTGDADALKKGSFVVAMGNPFAIESDGEATVSWGVIANVAQKAPAGENLNDAPDPEGAYRSTLHHFGTLLQTDAKLGWNASGGALVTLDGELIGITTTTSTIAGHESPAGYAIPMSATIRRIVGQLAEGREAEYGLLGVSFSRMPPRGVTPASGGMLVGDAYQGSPAQRAGIRQGDVIVRVGGGATPDADALQLVVGSLPPGSEAVVEFERDHQPAQTTVQLGKAFVVGERVTTNKSPAWRGMRVDYATAVPAQVLQQKAQMGLLDPAGCVVVSEVEPDSVSWRSGVRPFVYVSHVGGKRVGTPQEFYRAVATAPESVKLTFTEPIVPPAAGPPAAQAVPPIPAPLEANPVPAGPVPEGPVPKGLAPAPLSPRAQAAPRWFVPVPLPQLGEPVEEPESRRPELGPDEAPEQ
ncbi:MAG: trypsin-like peptidase domain-containing protein [Lacipirellulaceae bacterium]